MRKRVLFLVSFILLILATSFVSAALCYDGKYYVDCNKLKYERYGYNDKALKSNIANFYKNFRINSKNIRVSSFNKTPAWTIIQNKEIKISSTEIRKQREQLRYKN